MLIRLLLLLPFAVWHTAAQAGDGPVDRTVTCNRYLISPRPSGTTCNAKGSLTSPQVLYELNSPISSTEQLLQDCRDACFDRGRFCQSFSVNKSIKRCRLYKVLLNQMGFKAGGFGDTVPDFYSRNCYDESCNTVVTDHLTIPGRYYEGDNFFICPPFPVTFYNTNKNCFSMATNGYLIFSSESSSYYTNTPLPNYNIGNSSLAVLWTDLYKRVDFLAKFPCEEMYWTYSGAAPNRKITMVWKIETSEPDFSNPGWVHVEASYTESNRGVWTVNFVELVNGYGSDGTIGMQNRPTGQFVQAAYDTGDIRSGTIFTFYSNSNTYSRVN